MYLKIHGKYIDKRTNITNSIKSFNIENIRNNYIYENTNALPSLIYWYRIIYFDCCHKIINDSYLYDYINTINSEYKWCIESNPFIEDKSFKDIIKLLTVDNFFTDYKEMGNFAVNNIFRRNNLVNVSKEYNINVTTKTIWLDFTEKEKNIYNKYLENIDNKETYIFLRKMCNCLNIEKPHVDFKNFKTFDDIIEYININNNERIGLINEKKI